MRRLSHRYPYYTRRFKGGPLQFFEIAKSQLHQLMRIIVRPEENLILEICQCPNIALAKNDSSHPCHEIVNVQNHNSNEFQLPEPWNGNITQAKLLFISSNPSIDESEAYPTVDWPNHRILDFFQNRFHPERKWTEDARRVLTKDGMTYAKRTVPYWNETRSMASDAFDRIAIPGEDYSLTEVAHCKSRSRKGVKSCAKTCFDLWMSRIISASDARVLIVLGDEAKEMMSEFLDIDPEIQFNEGVFLGNASRIVLFLPAPGSNKIRKIRKVFSEKQRSILKSVLNH